MKSTYTFKYQGYGDLAEFDGQPIEIIRDVTPRDRGTTVEPYTDLVKIIRLPSGNEIGARADEIVEHYHPVHVVEVFDRSDGVYVFADHDDAVAFEEAVNAGHDVSLGSRCLRREEVVCTHEDTLKLIESEREDFA